MLQTRRFIILTIGNAAVHRYSRQSIRLKRQIIKYISARSTAIGQYVRHKSRQPDCALNGFYCTWLCQLSKPPGLIYFRPGGLLRHIRLCAPRQTRTLALIAAPGVNERESRPHTTSSVRARIAADSCPLPRPAALSCRRHHAVYAIGARDSARYIAVRPIERAIVYHVAVQPVHRLRLGLAVQVAVQHQPHPPHARRRIKSY